MTWNCRVIKYDTSEPWDDEYYHAIHEVFYDEEGKVFMYTEVAVDVGGNGFDGAKEYYNLLAEAFKAPVLLMSELPKFNELPEYSCGLCDKEITEEGYNFDGLCDQCHQDILDTV